MQDFAKSLSFYKDGLGWQTDAKPTDTVAFIQLSGLVLGLYPKHLLAEDATVPHDGKGFTGITLAHNVGSETEVDQVLQEAEQAGARIVKPAQKTSWGGYSGYFADPDGYLWEVAHNPFWGLHEDGRVILSPL